MPRANRRPVIGVTGPSGLAWGRVAACLRLRRCGAAAVPLAPDRPRPSSELDALVITGGSDIDPSLYGSAGPWVNPDPVRDEFELAALRFADLRNLPVLGICRGAQLINVSRGGSLFGDITELRKVTSNRPTLLPRKTVTVDGDSRLAKALGDTTVRVNSLHHQAVDRLGDGLKIVATDQDDIVQGLEAAAGRLVLGVQWHPEYLPFHRAQRRLFATLVEAAVERQQ